MSLIMHSGGIVATIVAAWAALAAITPDGVAPFELPAPTGPHAIGTTSWRLTDPSRREIFIANADARQVEVTAWYPTAERGGSLAPYLREGLPEVRTFATVFRAADTVFDSLASVRTHSALDAAPDPAGRKFPVLLFSHGYTAIPSSYTALLEDLASHGYAVLSVVHPYEGTAATLADGHVVTLLDGAGKMRAPLAEVFAEWATEDDAMAAVTRAEDRSEQLRLLRGYLSGLSHTNAVLKRWVDDTKLVLDTLTSLPRDTPAARLASRLDVNRLGVFGHSMGGVVAGQFCVDDTRCRAGLNLDGIPQSGTMIDASMPHPFAMVYSARPGRLGASDAIYARAAHPYYRVDVPDTRHLDFSDMVFWGGPLRERPVLGPIAPVRAVAITRAVVRRFFDHELLGASATLANGLAGFSEVMAKAVSR
jgi:predicted dienelactone hydrolase